MVNLYLDPKISVEDAKNSIGTVEGYDCCQTLVEKSKYMPNGLTKLLYDILKSKNSERENYLKNFYKSNSFIFLVIVFLPSPSTFAASILFPLHADKASFKNKFL